MDAERARRFPFAARAGTTPLRIARAEGAWLYTEDGQAILDAAGGAIVANVGHGRREVAEAYAREVERASYLVPPFVDREPRAPRRAPGLALASGGTHSRRVHERRLGVRRRGAAHRARAPRRAPAGRSAGR